MVIAIIIIAFLVICYFVGDSETSNTSSNQHNNNVPNIKNTARKNKDAEYDEVLQVLGKYWLEYKKGAFAEAPTQQLITQHKLDSKYDFNKDDVWKALKRYNEVFECYPNNYWSTGAFPNVIIDYSSYLEELEFQYKIYLTEMFKPEKIQDFISHFYLGKRKITCEDILKDLQEIVSNCNQSDFKLPDTKQIQNSSNKFDKQQFHSDKNPINDEKSLIMALEKCASDSVSKTLSNFHNKYYLNDYSISDTTLHSKAVTATNDYREKYILPEHILQEKRKERERSAQKNQTSSNTNNKQTEQESVSNGITVNLQPPIQIGYYTENPMPFCIEKIIIKDYMAYLYDSIENGYIRVHLLNGRNKFNCDNVPATKYTYTAYQGTPCWAVLNTICTASVIWEGNYPFNPSDVFNTLSTQNNADIAPYGISCEMTQSKYMFQRNKQSISLEVAIRTLCFVTPVPSQKAPSITDTNVNARNGNVPSVLNLPEEWTVWQYHIIQKHTLVIDDIDTSIIPENTRYFYPSAYLCPTCQRHISKALIQHRNYIKVKGKKAEIDKVFTCKYCKEFFAPIMEHNLDCGVLFHLKTTNTRYSEIVQELDACGRFHDKT